MTKKKTKYKTTITKKDGITWGNFESSDDGMTTVISTHNNGRGRAQLKKIRKKRIGAK